jgi:uncharacterized protein with FMN-binding domain
MPDVGQSSSNRRAANSLLALSSAAVLAVYAAGYTRTRAAADRFAAQTEARRPAPREPRADATPHAAPAERLTPPAPAPAARKRIDGGTARERKRPAKPRSLEAKAIHSVADAALGALGIGALPPDAAPVASAPAAPSAPLAPAPSAPLAPSAPSAPVLRDGTYYGWGTSRHGDIQAAVVIERGRIASATIAQCLTRYSCSVIAKLPPQVSERQSPEVDYVSGATQSTNAFYYAVVEALGQAKAK